MSGKKKIAAFILSTVAGALTTIAQHNGWPIPETMIAWIVTLGGTYILGETAVDVARAKRIGTSYK